MVQKLSRNSRPQAAKLSKVCSRVQIFDLSKFRFFARFMLKSHQNRSNFGIFEISSMSRFDWCAAVMTPTRSQPLLLAIPNLTKVGSWLKIFDLSKFRFFARSPLKSCSKHPNLGIFEISSTSRFDWCAAVLTPTRSQAVLLANPNSAKMFDPPKLPPAETSMFCGHFARTTSPIYSNVMSGCRQS